MTKPKIHRIVAGSKIGRSFTQSKGIHIYNPNNIPEDIKKHNEEVERKRNEKKHKGEFS